jgi:Ca-activated chloride channel family protein
MSELLWSRPRLWPALLLLPLVLAALWAALRGRARGRARYGAVLAEVVPVPWRRALNLTAVAALLLVAAMEPLLGKEDVAVERRGLDLVFCLDTSRSMLARDLQPSRLERAKRDIKAVLPELVGGDRVGLVAFAGQARLMVPLTHDLESFGHLLDRVDTDAVRVGGTDLAAPLQKALDLVEAGQEATSVVVLLTDGEDLAGAGLQAAHRVRERGIVLFAVGYGSTRGSKILIEADGQEAFLKSGRGDEVVSAMDADGLRRMAEATGGELLRADAMPLPLVELKRKRFDPRLARSYEAGSEMLHKTRFQWVLLPAWLLLLFEMAIAGGRRRR